jgi:hypothetical protein
VILVGAEVGTASYEELEMIVMVALLLADTDLLGPTSIVALLSTNVKPTPCEELEIVVKGSLSVHNLVLREPTSVKKLLGADVVITADR